MMTTRDEHLLKILERLPKSETNEQASSGFAIATLAVRTHSDLIEEVQDCLNVHSEFSIERQVFYDSAQLHFHPYTAAMSIVGYAMQHGSQMAVDWYRKIINAKTATVRHSGLVSGLTVNNRIEFSNEISIMPLGEAGDGPQVLTARQHSLPGVMHGVFGTHFTAIAFRDAEYEQSDRMPRPPASHEFIHDTEEVLIGCVLNEGLAPALTVDWDEFCNSEMRAAENSYGSGGNPQEAPVTWGRVLTEDDVPNIELYLALEEKFRKKMRVALTRVGWARRKQSAANKAIEYSIALEALLSDGNTEMTHKISTRAAIILGEGIEGRAKYRKLIKALYALRSKAVHGSIVNEVGDGDVVRESERAISKLLVTAAQRGRDFDFDRLDLIAQT
uniref:HEPN domain-containing protein n=1 Tax=uncultured Erythrobacter sp. TaxID=263913 RepID=UPI00260412C6|nr:HEPN domain-containing protein [uncultured Erythrobacter sp.]